MRRPAAIALLAAALALSALAIGASPAAAAGRAAGHAGSYTPQLWLTADDGYRVAVSERGGAVTLSVVRRHGRRAAAVTTYAAKGTATTRVLRASFGRFGSIAMRFVPGAGKPRLAPHGHCHGFGTLEARRGVFVGRLRFRGEGGYVSVRAHRARGRLTRLARRCLHHRRTHRRRPRESLIQSSGNAAKGKEITYLAAQRKTATSSQSFLALKWSGKVAFLAMTSANAGRVTVFHAALAIDRPRAFTLNHALTGGHLAPGGPFAGSGTYAAAADGTRTWDGPLSVNFPGSPRFPLAGPDLEASVGTLPALFALFLLGQARAGDAVSLASALEKPTLLAAPARPR